MEQTHKSDEDIQKEIDGLFEKTIRTPSGRNKDISVYAEWESFFQKLLTDYDADRQKKYIFYWAEKAFQDLPNRNAPLFSLLYITGGSAEVSKERRCLFEYVAEYLLSHAKENPSIDKLVTQYVAKDCPDNKGRFGNIINTFRDILRKKYNRQQRKKILTSKLLMVTFGVLCGLAVGFVSGALVVFNITKRPDIPVAADETIGSSVTEVTSLVSEPSEVSSDSSSSAADHDQKQSSAKNSRTETTSSVSQPSKVSDVSTAGETSEQSSHSGGFWQPSLPSVVSQDRETSGSAESSAVSVVESSEESSAVSVAESSEESSQETD